MTKEDNNKWIGWAIVAVIALTVIALCFTMLQGKETYTTEDKEIDKTEAVQCVAKNPENAFFKNAREKESTHTIKIIFKKDSLDKINYDYEGIFETENNAETASAAASGQYNKYMAKSSLNPDTLRPIFSNVKNTTKVSLMADVDDLNHNNLNLFFLDMNDFQRIRSYSARQFADLYKNKGFSCTIHD